MFRHDRRKLFRTLEHRCDDDAAGSAHFAPEQVFRGLVADVLSGRYAPGERLPTQRALAAALGVNLASVREGVKQLEQLRPVETRHGDGMRVRDWRAQGGLDVLVHAVASGGGLDPPLREIFEARRLLLAECSALAAARRTGEQSALLGRLAGELRGAGAVAAQGLDLAFMATVIEAADNLAFALIANSIRDAYLERLDLFRPIVELRYDLVAAAVEARRRGGAGRDDGARARPGGAAAGGAAMTRAVRTRRGPALAVIAPREASILAALADAAAAPEPPLPPVAATDAATAPPSSSTTTRAPPSASSFATTAPARVCADDDDVGFEGAVGRRGSRTAGTSRSR